MTRSASFLSRNFFVAAMCIFAFNFPTHADTTDIGKVTDAARKSYKKMKMYGGGTAADQALKVFLNPTQYQIPPQWQDYLFTMITKDNPLPENRSEKWLGYYSQYMQDVQTKMEPTANYMEENCPILKLGDVPCCVPDKQHEFDHWTCRKR